MTPSREEEVFEEFAREFIRRHQGTEPHWPLTRILVATDFSLCSLNALEPRSSCCTWSPLWQ
jgi:hypothetical protein